VTPKGEHRPLVVAHRGSSGTAPENTMAAFHMAAAAGADMIEFDIRMTLDGEVVVHHDRRLGRTSNGSGRIRDLALVELRSLDAGAWYSRSFRGERIPMLREVLHDLPRSLGMNIEVKTDGDGRRGSAMEKSIVRAVRDARRSDSVLVTSFDHIFLRRFHRLDPGIQTGALCLPIRDGLRSASLIVRRIGASAFICSRAQLRARHVHDAHAHGITIMTYGVNTLAALASARRKGVDAVITNYPERMVRALRIA